MKPLQIHQFPCLGDNYGYLLHDPHSGETVAIDTPDADEILRQLKAKNWKLTQIWNTHHHFDHAGGNEAVKEATSAIITGPKGEDFPIPCMDRAVGEGNQAWIGDIGFEIIDVPGHTKGHIAYIHEKHGIAFVGDTLFALGCGRLFEGTPTQMWNSLSKLAALKDDMQIYCAHEYTQANAAFALTIEPWNQKLFERTAKINALRAKNMPTVPSCLGVEKDTNPFLRADDKKIAAHLGFDDPIDPVTVFTEIRRRKDAF